MKSRYFLPLIVRMTTSPKDDVILRSGATKDLLFIFVCSVVSVLSAVNSLSAQSPDKPPKPSQHGSVMQRIAGTEVTIQYNRPVARGRELFGALVRWGRVWNPGADEATSISFSTRVRVNGQELAAGTYTLWAEPKEDEWTLIFSKAYPAWHEPYPAGKDVLRVRSKPRTGEHFETLTFYFPVVDGKHAELVLHWGKVEVPLRLDVP